MRILITTQVVDKNDPSLGFFHQWIEEFAKHCERVEVICLYEGVHTFPENVHVYTLGKEKSTGSRRNLFLRIIYAIRFTFLLFKLRNAYDVVFVHMNPEYVLLGSLFWKLDKKKVSLWYMHRSVTPMLTCAEKLVDVIFTASPESFRLETQKLHIVGHGIDTEKFTHAIGRIREKTKPEKGASLRIVTIGRMSASKRVIEMLDVMDNLYERKVPFVFSIAGGTSTPEDEAYLVTLNKEIAKKAYHNQVVFLGAISHKRVPEILSHADVFLNLSTTGSLDKAVLEPLLLGIPAVTTNEAFREVLSESGLYVAEINPAKIAEVIQTSVDIDMTQLQKYVLENHSLTTLIPRILKILSEVTI